MSNTIVATSKPGRPSAIQTILTAGLIAGCFDLLTAIIVYSVVMQRTTDVQLLQGIGRAAFGDKTFDTGTGLALSGVGVHFFIAFSFAIFYFFIFPYVPFLRKQRIVGGLLYGVFVWCVLKLAVFSLFHFFTTHHFHHIGHNHIFPMVSSLAFAIKFYYLNEGHIKMGSGSGTHCVCCGGSDKLGKRKNVIIISCILFFVHFQILVIIMNFLKLSLYTVNSFYFSLFSSMINSISCNVLVCLTYVARFDHAMNGMNTVNVFLALCVASACACTGSVKTN